MSDLREVTLDGRVCIVTGAGRGIGREYALMLAFIAMVIAVAVAFLGHATSNQFASFKFSP